MLGRVINDKFKILSFIARGGMGKVYRAEQAPLGRVCALKVLNANYTGEHDPEFHKRFFLEASLTSKLRHPNTVTIFDYGQTTDGVYYMAMEYLEGYTLHRAIRQVGFLSEERTAYIARQVCRSLREAHSLGVVHRDLKPANVYLLEHGDEPDFVKVLDFGLVKDISGTEAEELTHAGLYMGSPKYMAPEQMSGGGVDGRTDIYALGVMMYEMVTGKVPFDRPKSLEILLAHLNEEVPPIKKMNPAARVSPAMEEAIFRSMAKQPKDRFRSMDELLAALKRLGPTTAAEPSASLTMDRMSQTGSGRLPSMGSGPSTGTGPTTGGGKSMHPGPTGSGPSHILRSEGAAMAVPVSSEDAPPESPVDMPAEAHGEAPLPAADAPPRGRSSSLVAAILGVIALAAGIGYATMHGRVPSHVATTAAVPPMADPTIEGTASPAPTAPTASASTGSVPVVDFYKLPAGAASGSPPPARGGPVTPNAAVAHPPTPMTQAPKAPVVAPKAPAVGATPAAKGAPDCNPSYYYDADGNKHFRPECFAH